MSKRTTTTKLNSDRRLVARAATAALAVAVAVVVWTVATQVFDIEVLSPEMGGEPPAPISAAQVVAASAAASLAAWGLLAALERLTKRPRRLWLSTAAGAFVLSLGAPLTGAGITGANQATLAALHVAVAAVVIPGMLRTTRAPGGDAEEGTAT